MTWIDDGGSPPAGVKVVLQTGTKIVFVQQENFANYTPDEAWQEYSVQYDSGRFDQDTPYPLETFDSSSTIPGGYTVNCTATAGGTDRITCTDTTGMTAGDTIWFTGDTIGGLNLKSFANNNQVYYILNVVNLTQFRITDTIDGTTPVDLDTDSGSMTANWGNARMDIYEVTIVPAASSQDVPTVQLSPYQQVAPNSYVTVTQGEYYATSQLYRPTSPGSGLTLINWQPLITSITVIGNETTFDEGSMQFIAPVDMYTTSDALDKYLVFPKANILV